MAEKECNFKKERLTGDAGCKIKDPDNESGEVCDGENCILLQTYKQQAEIKLKLDQILQEMEK